MILPDRIWTTFDEMVANMAVNAPHALIMDWALRLDRALSAWFVTMELRRPKDIRDCYDILRESGAFGSRVVEELSQLRRLRNSVVHDCYSPTREQATRYADDAWRLSWVLVESVGDRPFKDVA